MSNSVLQQKLSYNKLMLKHKDSNTIMLELWRNGISTVDELATACKLHVNDVVGELEELQNKGFVAQVGIKSGKALFQLLTNGEQIIKKHINTIIYINKRYSYGAKNN
jgi:predicted ArsR family transcriptional regulator